MVFKNKNIYSHFSTLLNVIENINILYFSYPQSSHYFNLGPINCPLIYLLKNKSSVIEQKLTTADSLVVHHPFISDAQSNSGYHATSQSLQH